MSELIEKQLFIIGAEKCGTTSLYRYLDNHNEIQLSIPKEPIFFEAEYNKGIKYYLETYYDATNLKNKILVDARHRNLFLPYVPSRIRKTVKNPKFIVLLREPVERAISHWTSRYISKQEHLEFKDAIEEDLLRIEAGLNFGENNSDIIWKNNLKSTDSKKGGFYNIFFRTYVDTGFYYEQLKRYYDIFGKENIKVYFSKELEQKPKEVMKDIFEFLKIEDKSDHINYQKYNKSADKQLIKKKSKSFNYLYKLIKKIIPNDIIINSKRILYKIKFNNNKLDKATIDNLRLIYQKENEKLNILIDREIIW